MISGSNSRDKIYGAINNYGKKVQETTKQAETMVNNILHHCEFSSAFFFSQSHDGKIIALFVFVIFVSFMKCW